MKDKLFLAWIHERLELIHSENPNYDYMHKLRSIIDATPAEQETPNIGGKHYETGLLGYAPAELREASRHGQDQG